MAEPKTPTPKEPKTPTPGDAKAAAPAKQKRAIKSGDKVLVVSLNKIATIRYIGTTQFQPGQWIGVEFAEAVGKHNGTVAGVKYFECPPDHGGFVKANMIRLVGTSAHAAAAATTAAPATPATAAAAGTPASATPVTPATTPATAAATTPAATPKLDTAKPASGAAATPTAHTTPHKPATAPATAATPKHESHIPTPGHGTPHHGATPTAATHRPSTTSATKTGAADHKTTVGSTAKVTKPATAGAKTTATGKTAASKIPGGKTATGKTTTAAGKTTTATKPKADPKKPATAGAATAAPKHVRTPSSGSAGGDDASDAHSDAGSTGGDGGEGSVPSTPRDEPAPKPAEVAHASAPAATPTPATATPAVAATPVTPAALPTITVATPASTPVVAVNTPVTLGAGAQGAANKLEEAMAKKERLKAGGVGSAAFEEEISRLKRQVDTLTEQYQTCSKQLEEERRASEEMKTKLADITKSKEENDEKLDHAYAELEETKQKLAAAQKAAAAAPASASTSTTAATAPAPAVAVVPKEVTEELIKVKRQLEESNKKIGEWKQKCDDTQKKCDEWKAKSDGSAGAIKAAEAAAAQAKSTADLAQQKIDIHANTNQTLREELQASVKQRKELEEAKHRLETLCETLTVDKELAEASKEELETSVENMRQAQARMEKEVEALRESEKNSKETIISSLPADQADGARLVAQNKELTAALIKLRDASQEQSKIQEETILELGGQLKEASDEAARVSALSKQLAESREQCESLKRQVDEAQGFSSMVEDLTEKNLSIGEEAKRLAGQVAHMQTLIDAAEEVEDGHVEYEAQMQSEIETKDGDLQESARVIATKEKQIAELNMTVRNFRQLVRKMEVDQQNLTARAASIAEQKQLESIRSSRGGRGAASGVDAYTLNLRLTALHKTARTEHLNGWLERLNAKHDKLRLMYTLAYVPDNLSIDDKGLALIHTAYRLYGKAQTANSLLDKYYGVAASVTTAAGGASSAATSGGVSEALSVFAYRVCVYLLELQRQAQVILVACVCASRTAYQQASLSSGDLLSIEKFLDSFLGLIASDSLTEHSPVDALQVGIKTGQSFLLNHFAEFVLPDPNAADSSKLNSVSAALLKTPTKTPTKSEKDSKSADKSTEKKGDTKALASAGVSALLAPGAVTRLSVAYESQQLLVQQQASRLLFQGLGDLVAGVIASFATTPAAAAPSAAGNTTASGDSDEVEGAAKRVVIEDPSALALQKLANDFDNAQMNAFTLCQQIATTTGVDLPLGSQFFIDAAAPAPAAGAASGSAGAASVDAGPALTTARVNSLPRSPVDFVTLRQCSQLSAAVHSATLSLSSAATKLIRMNASAPAPAPAAATGAASVSALVAHAAGSALSSAVSGGDAGAAQLAQQQKLVKQLDQLLSNELKSGALKSDLDKFHHALMALNKQTAAPPPPVVAPSKVDKKNAAAGGKTEAAAESAVASAVSTWAAHGATIRAEIGAAAAVKGTIDDKDRSIQSKTLELFDLKKEFQKQMAKNDVIGTQLTNYVKDTASLRAELERIKSQERQWQVTLDSLTKDNRDQNERIARLGTELDAARDALTRARTAAPPSSGGGLSAPTGGSHGRTLSGLGTLSKPLNGFLEEDGTPHAASGGQSNVSTRVVSDAELDSLYRTISILRHQVTILAARQHTVVRTATSTGTGTAKAGTEIATASGNSTTDLLQSLPPLPLSNERRSIVQLHAPALHTATENTANAVHLKMRVLSGIASREPASGVVVTPPVSGDKSGVAPKAVPTPLANFQNDLNRLSAAVQQFRCSPAIVDLSDRKPGASGETKTDKKPATSSSAPAPTQPPLQQFLARRAHANRLKQQSEHLHRAITTELDSTHRLSRFVDVPIADSSSTAGLRLIGRVRPASASTAAVAAPERVLVQSIDQLSQLARVFAA